MNKLSIIIPYYNTKKWCENIIKKLLYQMILYPQTEIILIDDCSTEDTSWLDKYKYLITIIHNEENMGVSFSRNAGLERATGNYIQFVDSDDDITTYFLSVIYENLNERFDYSLYRWYANGKVTEGDIPEESIKWNWAVWGYTFKRKVIGNIRFDETKNCMEDYDFISKVINKWQTRHIVDTPIYIYNSNNENSICHLIEEGKLDKIRK